MTGFIIGLVVGLVVGWVFLPEPAFVRKLFEKIGLAKPPAAP